MSTTLIDRCDIAAYRAWTQGRVGPGHLRGVPTWVWRSALSRPDARRGVTVAP